MNRTIAVIVGSLRKGSWNRKLAEAVSALAPSNLKFKFVEIGDLAFYDEDLEANAPLPWVRFRNEIRSADAVMFATPEYNRSVPAVLKNAVDVGSRPYGKSAFNGKPAAVISGSVGAIGGFGANHHLRQSLAFLNMATLPAEAYVGAVHELFDEEGAVKNEATRAFLAGFAQSFADWIDTHLNKTTTAARAA